MSAPAHSYIRSRRLFLVPATRELTRADLSGRPALAESLGCEVPENWPPEHYSRPAVDWVLRQLEHGQARGWHTWYLLLRQEPLELAGVCGFKGRPDAEGSVEISYALLPQFHRRGLATEAVNRLVEWAFTHPRVTEVCAETLPSLVPSIRVLEKCGFTQAGKGSEHGVIRYALGRHRLY
ncbi:MAG: GNAT family N-acetyltransferase [Gammaproteobacteria bacterium]